MNIVTILIALGGWGFAFYQMKKNREWQKKDLLANRRFDAYSDFMKKLEEINESIRNNPNMIYGISNEFMASLLNGNTERLDNAVLNFNQQLIDYVKTSVKPLLIINQEINPLLLVASDELVEKLNQLKELISDFNNEMQNCLSRINAKNSDSFKQLGTISHDNRWKKFQVLNDEILVIMRKEINVK